MGKDKKVTIFTEQRGDVLITVMRERWLFMYRYHLFFDWENSLVWYGWNLENRMIKRAQESVDLAMRLSA